MMITNLMKYRLTAFTALSTICLMALVLADSPITRLNSAAEGLPVGEQKSLAESPATREIFSQLPLSFEANRGQTDPRVKFLSRGQGYTFYLTPTEAVMELRRAGLESRVETSTERAQNSVDPQSRSRASQSTILRMRLVGANQNPNLAGAEETFGKSNYLLGDDPQKWQTNVSNYAKVKYEQVYPGVDMVYYGNQQQLEYDFVVARGANPQSIKLSFAGADKVRIDESGDLILETKAGEVRQRRPVIFQEVDGQRKQIAGKYSLTKTREVGFEIGEYDRSRTLVIDPVLSYSTILGKSSIPRAVAVDAQGNVYLSGYLQELLNFPLTPGALQIATDSSVFVMKFSANSMTLMYSAIFGGTAAVSGQRGPLLSHRVNGAFAVDAAGNAYIAGTTASANFPTTPGAYQRTYTATAENGSLSGFLVKLNSAGNGFGYSTLFKETVLSALTVDSVGQVYLTGGTYSPNFPTTPDAFQKTLDNPNAPLSVPDVFLTKFSADGSQLVYSTYLGGGGGEEAMSIALDAAGNIYLAGMTTNGVVGGGVPNGNPFPTTPNAFKGVPDLAAASHTFVTKMNPAGTALIYSTLLPGGTGRSEQPDGPIRLAVDSQGQAHVMSQTRYANFPTTPGAYQRTGGGTNLNHPNDDIAVTKLSADGSKLLYSTYLGATDSGDITGGLAVDAAGNAYALYRFGEDKFYGKRGVAVAKLNPTGSTRLQFIPLSFGEAIGAGIALDAGGNIYITGMVQPPFYPTTPGSLQPNFPGTGQHNYTGFFTKISETNGIPIPSPSPTVSPTPFPFVVLGGRITDGAVTNEIKGLTETAVFVVNEGVLVNKTKTFANGFYVGGRLESDQVYRVIPYRQGHAFTPPGADFYGPYERESTNFVGRASANAPGFPEFTSFSITGRVRTADGRPVPNATVSLFGLEPLLTERTTTDANGRYSLTILPLGEYGIGVEKAGYRFSSGFEFRLNANLTFDFTVEYEPNTATVVSAANYLAEIAPESIVTAFGTDLANTTRAAMTLPLPEELGGTRVMFRDSASGTRQAPLFFVSPTQVSFLIPAGTPSGEASVQIFYPNGKVSIASFNVSRVAPALFTADASGRGLVTAVALRVKADGTQSYEPVIRFDSALGKVVGVPIDLGAATDQVFLLPFGTGLRNRSGMGAVSALLGGTNAQVVFIGAQGGFAGLDQANVLIPRSLIGRGEVDLVLSVDGKMANTVKVWIK